MLSLLEQSHELPEEHFLSVAMTYNDSTEAQSFQASADFCAVPGTKETDLDELHAGSAPSSLSHCFSQLHTGSAPSTVLSTPPPPPPLCNDSFPRTINGSC